MYLHGITISFAKIKPAMNQIEIHPYHSQPDLVAFCQSQRIAVTAYSPFGSTHAPVLQDAVIKSIAETHSRTPAQVVLKWGIQRGIATIPKSTSEARIQENAALDGFELSDEEVQAISGLDQHKIYVNPVEWWGFPYF